MPTDVIQLATYAPQTVLYVVVAGVLGYLIRRLNTREAQLDSLYEARREDSMKNMDVLKDLTTILDQAVGGQETMRDEVSECYDKLTRDLKEGIERLEGVIREKR